MSRGGALVIGRVLQTLVQSRKKIGRVDAAKRLGPAVRRGGQNDRGSGLLGAAGKPREQIVGNKRHVARLEQAAPRPAPRGVAEPRMQPGLDHRFNVAGTLIAVLTVDQSKVHACIGQAVDN